MALLPILEFPDPRLRKVASPVTHFDDRLRSLVANMLETMYHAEGIGLAATQVNVHKRLLVLDVSQEKDSPHVFVNPEFEVIEEELQDYQEGCLSVPGFFEDVSRPRAIRVSARDQHGEAFELEARGVLAVCIQHEIDHLDGKLFVDYLSPLKRRRIRGKLQKEQRKSA
ncbi:MAG: peptide deformylase [Gammaproteobacteria bacterium]|nr:peptide deformylase [Gammaproteobacteria bacterium]MCY4268869.1 peptide deformylase [Gammaproteobacteria bacterium]MCY4295614.1 peptide deformylase [Gammaproteobacteria bacterium]